MSITTSVYGGGPFYPGEGSALSGINECGFTTLVCWAVHVQSNGDLVYNDTPIVTGGSYVGDANWGALLKAAKSGGSVNRILFSIGGWGTSDFTNIQNLIEKDGNGPGTALYNSFKALYEAIGVIDGIDLDNEDNYNGANSVVSFCEMLSDIGYKEITFCPYTSVSYWETCLRGLQESRPGLVTAYNLQCYAGGAGNPYMFDQWIDSVKSVLGDETKAEQFIMPGVWCLHGDGCNEGMDPSQVETQFQHWKSNGFVGGFIWLFDDLMKCGPDPQAYAQAIVQGLG